MMNRPYMFSTPRTKLPKSGFYLSLYVQYTQSILEPFIFVRPYPNLLTLCVQYTKTLALKKCLPFKLTFAVYLEYIETIHFVHL